MTRPAVLKLVPLLLCLSCAPAFAQGADEAKKAYEANIIPNHSFEDSGTATESHLQNPWEFNLYAPPWFSPNLATPDLVTDRLLQRYENPPLPFRHGQASAGIIARGPGYAEYIAVPLERPLQKGMVYTGSFWVRKAKEERFSQVESNSHFGIWLGDTIKHPSEGMIRRSPQVHDASAVISTKEWVKIEASFVASGNFTHAYIGQFLPAEGPLFSVQGFLLIDEIRIETVRSETPPQKGFQEEKIELFFSNNSAEIAKEEKEKLQTVAAILQNNNAIYAHIVGHASLTGTKQANLALSVRRADAVAEYLRSLSVDGEQLHAFGLGDLMPKTVAQDAAANRGKGQDRRVEIYLTQQPSYPSELPAKEHRSSSQIIESGDTPSLRLGHIGAYAAAWHYYEENEANPVFHYMGRMDSLRFLSYSIHPAQSLIGVKSQQTEMLLINEAHHFPQHRAFICSILHELKRNGYRHLGAEVILNTAMLNSLGYPTLHNGPYIQEPTLAALFRLAKDLGFHVFEYEATEFQLAYFSNILRSKKAPALSAAETIEFTQKSASSGEEETIAEGPKTLMNARDVAQAVNIMNYKARYPEGKTIILGGFGHIKERPSGDWQPMGFRLAQLFDADPLTVDQTRMNAHHLQALESPYYRLARPERPVAFTDEQGGVFVAKEFDPFVEEQFVQYFDVSVFHPKPRNKPVTNRPEWLEWIPEREAFRFETKAFLMGETTVVKAYIASENLSISIPVDALEISASHDSFFLYLPYAHDKYTLLSVSDEGEIRKQSFDVIPPSGTISDF